MFLFLAFNIYLLEHTFYISQENKFFGYRLIYSLKRELPEYEMNRQVMLSVWIALLHTDMIKL